MSSKDFFQVTNSMLGKEKSCVLSTKDQKEMAENFADYFKNKIEKIQCSLDSNTIPINDNEFTDE